MISKEEEEEIVKDSPKSKERYKEEDREIESEERWEGKGRAGRLCNMNTYLDQRFHRAKIPLQKPQFWTFSDHIQTISVWKLSQLVWCFDWVEALIILFNISEQILTFLGIFLDFFWTTSGHLSDNPIFKVLISSILIANGQNWSNILSHFGGF